MSSGKEVIALFLNASMSADGNARCEESAETPIDSRKLSRTHSARETVHAAREGQWEQRTAWPDLFVD